LEIKGLLGTITHLLGTRPVFVAGGCVRDWLLEKGSKDIDLVLPDGAVAIAKAFGEDTGGAFVLLDEAEDVARVVVDTLSFDFSGFRKGAKTIEEDLAQRDFTMNAMAVPLSGVMAGVERTTQGLLVARPVVEQLLIDPYGGAKDLGNRMIRAVAIKNLHDDALRMLRAFRFMALLDFSIHEEVLDFVRANAALIGTCASERVNYELECIMASPRAGKALSGLYNNRLLEAIIPEIKELEGVEQPGFHHLDVLGHCLEAVSCMDKLVQDPCMRFGNCEVMKAWLQDHRDKTAYLKWAALFHDFGKPSQKGLRKDGRVTFYNHDKKGAEMAAAIAKRLRWSKSSTIFVQRLVRMHMRPFHLLNDLRKGGPTKRAMRKLLEEIESDYPALFLLSMADSMAGCGPMKPAGLDQELSRLFDKIHGFYLKRLMPARKSPPLLTGRDVMDLFSIGPGPLIGKALRAIEARRIEGIIRKRDEAISWLKKHFPDDLAEP